MQVMLCYFLVVIIIIMIINIITLNVITVIIIISDSVVSCCALPAMGGRGTTRWTAGPGLLVCPYIYLNLCKL